MKVLLGLMIALSVLMCSAPVVVMLAPATFAFVAYAALGSMLLLVVLMGAFVVLA